MSGSEPTGETGGTPQPGASHSVDDNASSVPAPLPPVAQEKTDGPADIAEFAARLDVVPVRVDVKG